MKIKAMNGTEFEVSPEEIKRQAEMMGMRMHSDHHYSKAEYHKKAQENISALIDHVHKIEDEDDAKEILAHCLNLSEKQADLLFEMMEFAYGWAGSKTN